MTDKIEIDIIELSKVRSEYEKNKQNKKAQWALFISDPNKEEVKEIMKNNEDNEKTIITVHKMTEEEKKRRIEDLKEKARLDEKAIWRKGYQDGYKEGLAIARKEKIKIMKEHNMSDKDICEILKITKEELDELLI